MTHSHNDGDASADGRTVHKDLKDGKVIALESYRPVEEGPDGTPEQRTAYALRELEPFLEMARQGKIRSLVVAAELVGGHVRITYPVGTWEPGLIAATELARSHLLEQGG